MSNANDEDVVTWPGTAADTSSSDAETDDKGAEIDDKVAEIEVTREEMLLTVDEIGDRLRPSNILDDAKQTVRDATVGRVEETVQTMTQTADRFTRDPARTTQEIGSGVIDTIKRNPVPAAMAGVGLTWLFLSRGGSQSSWSGDGYGDRSATRWQPGQASWERASARPGGESIGDRAGQTASQAADAVGRTVERARDNVDQFLDDAGRTVGRVPDQASDATRRLTTQAQRVIDDNPLGIATAALAVGTVIGLALPSTPAEHRILGQTSQGLIDRAGEAATETLDQVDKSTDQQRSSRSRSSQPSSTGTSASRAQPSTRRRGTGTAPTGA